VTGQPESSCYAIEFETISVDPSKEHPMNGQLAVVAGAGPGLGRALAERFARGGMRVALLARDPKKLAAVAASAGPQALPIACDLTDPQAVAAAFDRIEREAGAPHCVVFNAGAYRPGGVLEIEPEDFLACWKAGCFAGLLVGQQAGRRMVQRGSGSMLFTGATASLRGGARFANLAAPKFGLRALAQSMARELGPRGVHVAHVIIDGQIAPGRGDAPAQPDARLEPAAIAESYWQLHQQPRSAWTLELDLRPWVERF
jgi:NAD(P)-dependent dehydrogenase (short-subunit alcohol dehydrogenase family)